MQKTFFLFLISLFIFSGCNIQEREKKLELKEIQLNQKEIELNLKEQTLALQEQELNANKIILDSVQNQNDYLLSLYPDLQGIWNVKMICTETTCPGFAIGDVKIEIWDFSIQNNTLIAAASNTKGILARIYSGTLKENHLELVSEVTDDQTGQGIKMLIKLRNTSGNTMSGTREIFYANGCYITYTLDIKKQKTK